MVWIFFSGALLYTMVFLFLVNIMSTSWFTASLPIALLFMFRMLGLFMLIPIFSLFAKNYTGATPVLIGVAMGAYGLTQGLFQLPMGVLSDKIGRKPVLLLGFFLFLAGSLLGVYADNIYILTAARALQGLGAVGSVLIASLADRTEEQHRAKSMAIIGISIAISFALAMICGPYLAAAGSLPLIFWSMVIMSVCALLIIPRMVFPPKKTINNDKLTTMLKTVLRKRALVIFDLGIFCQHATLTSTFFALPIVLTNTFNLNHSHMGTTFYLPVMLVSFILMFPIVALTERRKRSNIVYKIAVLFMFLAQLLFTHTTEHWWTFSISATLYFFFFNIVEATLPAIVSTNAPEKLRGTAMGVYSSFQFLGIFFGGLMSGVAYQLAGTQGVFMFNSVLVMIWILANTML